MFDIRFLGATLEEFARINDDHYFGKDYSYSELWNKDNWSFTVGANVNVDDEVEKGNQNSVEYFQFDDVQIKVVDLSNALVYHPPKQSSYSGGSDWSGPSIVAGLNS